MCLFSTILIKEMSIRTRWLLAVIGLLIICLALAGLAYSLWPLANSQERFHRAS